ncbi:hypothetical protein B0H11DRAFT_1905331 [Mycena galericulata]|nr:hypothetical protein B0H11DRAFT_1905331 [Mycena galericulata]
MSLPLQRWPTWAPPSSLISLQESGSTRLLRVLSSKRTSRPLIWAWNRDVFSKRNTKRPDQWLHPYRIRFLSRSVALQSQTLDVRPEDNTLKRCVLPDSCNEIREDGGAATADKAMNDAVGSMYMYQLGSSNLVPRKSRSAAGDLDIRHPYSIEISTPISASHREGVHCRLIPISEWKKQEIEVPIDSTKCLALEVQAAKNVPQAQASNHSSIDHHKVGRPAVAPWRNHCHE